jgi:hypothetical protein
MMQGPGSLIEDRGEAHAARAISTRASTFWLPDAHLPAATIRCFRICDVGSPIPALCGLRSAVSIPTC